MPNKLSRARPLLTLRSIAVLACASSFATIAEAADSTASAVLEEVVVTTARQRVEPLQRVPDSITAFPEETIESAGIRDLRGFMDKTPNLFFRQGFRSGFLFITMRGITTSQNGWAPVTLNIDGIPTATLEGFNQGTLFDLQSIEVLKGPQSALYGAGAIGGAINISTRAPSDQYTAEVQAIGANGNDIRFNGSISGPLAGSFKFRLAGSHRDSDGTFKSRDGDPLDFKSESSARLRLVGEVGPISVDLRGFVLDSRPGALMQDVLPSTNPAVLQTLLDEYDLYRPERGILGFEDRQVQEFGGKLAWQLPLGEVALLGGYSNAESNTVGTASWSKPPFQAATPCGPVGNPGQPADCIQNNTDNAETTTVDLRFTSPSEQRLRWIVGAAHLDRETLNTFYLDQGVLNSSGKAVDNGPPRVFGSTHFRTDDMYGIYAQFNYDLSTKTELTVAGRYDRNRYDNVQYTDESLSRVVTLADGTTRQVYTDSAFQPKFVLSHRWTEDVLAYATVAKGFRTGYFNSGQRASPEATWNYELGLKSAFLENKLVINSAVFHIDYTNQQVSFVTATPPFRGSTNIPGTDIDGFELDLAAVPTEGLSLSVGVGVADARVLNGTEAPTTPKLTFNMGAEYAYPIAGSLAWKTRADYRRQGSYYLLRNNVYNVSPKNYLNLRTTLQADRWSAGLWTENLLNERQVNSIAVFAFGMVRDSYMPRTYGVDLRYKF